MNIDNILEEKGMTKAELARKMDILPGNLLGALKNPTEHTIRKFANALEVPMYRLFEEQAPHSKSTYVRCPHCKKSIHIIVMDE